MKMKATVQLSTDTESLFLVLCIFFLQLNPLISLLANFISIPPSMARSLSRTLTLAKFPPKSTLSPFTTTKFTPSSSSIPQPIAEFARRYRSTHATRAQLIEIDLDSSPADGDVEVLGLERLEDAIHSIMVQRSAPAWLVFRPGTSYYVPPKPRAANIVQLIGKLANPLMEEESLAFTSDCGWPSSSYFLNGNGFPELIPKEVEVGLHVECNDKTSKSEDEE